MGRREIYPVLVSAFIDAPASSRFPAAKEKAPVPLDTEAVLLRLTEAQVKQSSG